jgi:hypothetical protein
MAKVTAPALSFGARGTLAKTLVYSSWRGRLYTRTWVKPANPNTTAQQSTRNTFSWLNFVNKIWPAEMQETYTLYVQGQPMTPLNGFIKQNLSRLRGQTDLTAFIFSPGAKGGLPPVSMGLTAGTNSITAAVTVPPLPSGWSVTNVIVAAIANQSPATGTLYTITSGTDASTPYSVELTGLTTAAEYIVGSWIKYAKGDNMVAYSPSIQDTATPT